MTKALALTRAQIAWRAAQDIPDGAVVNLGVGMPLGIPNHIPSGREVVFHSENGLLGMGPPAAEGEEDWELINAGTRATTLLAGGSFFHHADSFAMIRGGHIDICALGAFQIAANGDLANWDLGDNKRIPTVGAPWIWPPGRNGCSCSPNIAPGTDRLKSSSDAPCR